MLLDQPQHNCFQRVQLYATIGHLSHSFCSFLFPIAKRAVSARPRLPLFCKSASGVVVVVTRVSILSGLMAVYGIAAPGRHVQSCVVLLEASAAEGFR